MGKVLEQLGLLTEMDMAAFADTVRHTPVGRTEEFITQHGTMVRTRMDIYSKSQVSIAQTNLKIMLKFCEQFGLTPSARSRIVGGEGAVEPTDEMELCWEVRSDSYEYTPCRFMLLLPITTRRKPTVP